MLIGASQVELVVNNSAASAGDIEMWVRSLGGEDPLEEGMATLSSILAWKIPTGREAWWTTVLGVIKSWIRVNN